MSTALKHVVTLFNELYAELEEQRYRPRRSAARALKLIDEIENQIDHLLAQMAPERITDERFEAAWEMVKRISDELVEVRGLLEDGRLDEARRRLRRLEAEVRKVYRLLLLIRSGAPLPLVFQLAPDYVRELRAPEAIVHDPMAMRIYNIVVRRGGVTLDELVRELGVTDENREEFNRAVTNLISMGFVTVSITPDNRIVLRPAR